FGLVLLHALASPSTEKPPMRGCCSAMSNAGPRACSWPGCAGCGARLRLRGSALRTCSCGTANLQFSNALHWLQPLLFAAALHLPQVCQVLKSGAEVAAAIQQIKQRMHFHYRAAIHVQQRHSHTEVTLVKQAQIGQIKWEAGAVVQAQQNACSHPRTAMAMAAGQVEEMHQCGVLFLLRVFDLRYFGHGLTSGFWAKESPARPAGLAKNDWFGCVVMAAIERLWR
ncbi:hypothetical protein, partial [Comamonas sp. B-9]|uniref:hypothetical protein n=1 Tax=Comamonas sp. B-9 TaxID=1055192 RepID=UPI001955473A